MELDENYIVVTPLKNEEKHLPGLIESIVRQTVKPLLWVIVDDNSTDNTPEILKKIEKRYNWIKIRKSTKEAKEAKEFRYSLICRTGFDFAINYCTNNKIKYNYMGLVDADVLLGGNYFEELITEFKRNSKLGIASGELWNVKGDEKKRMEQREDLPPGAARLWSRICFEDTGGYYLTSAPDAVSTAKARLKGWETKTFKKLKFEHLRPVGSEGYWERFKGFGMYNYYVNLNFFYAIFKGLHYSLTKPHYIGLAYLYGYLSSFILRKKQIDDRDIKNYYQRVRIEEMKTYHINRLKDKLRIFRQYFQH